MNHRNRKRVLLADNSQEYRRSVIGLLDLEGYAVTEAETHEQAIETLEHQEFELVLADLRMRDEMDPHDVSGVAVAKFASECGMPCIMVTAFPSVELARMVLRSLHAEPFAKDLITKASGPQALLDSIRLTLEHVEQGARRSTEAGLFVDLEKEVVYIGGDEVDVTTKQYLLLAELWRKNEGICSPMDLIRAIYDAKLGPKEAQNDKALKNLVKRTKDKLKEKDPNHKYIETVPRRGYRINLKR
jgi:DNA-binding response OmpR family regulator